MSCSSCGTLFPGSGKFCQKCGAALPQQSGAQIYTQPAPISLPSAPSASVSSAPPAPTTWSGQAGGPQPGQTTLPARVVVTDINMSFGSMVVFMVKWTIAAIPAIIILLVLLTIISAVLGGVFGGLLYGLF